MRVYYVSYRGSQPTCYNYSHFVTPQRGSAIFCCRRGNLAVSVCTFLYVCVYCDLLGKCTFNVISKNVLFKRESTV